MDRFQLYGGFKGTKLDTFALLKCILFAGTFVPYSKLWWNIRTTLGDTLLYHPRFLSGCNAH